MTDSKWCYHQPVVHADFAETDSNRVDVFLVDPGLEQLHSKGCRHPCTHTQQMRNSDEARLHWCDFIIRVPMFVLVGHMSSPSLTRFSLKRLFRMEADKLPLASRIPVSMASLLRSDSVNPFRNSSNWRHKTRASTHLVSRRATSIITLKPKAN